MELKPCKCGSADIKLRLAVRAKTGKGAYCYQCKECGKAAYAWAESEEIATELWNDTVNNTQKLRVVKQERWNKNGIKRHCTTHGK